MGRFEGRNVIVTGASSGIGWAIAHAFVDEGASVFAVARRDALLEKMRAESSVPDRVRTAVVDVGVPEQARGMVVEAIAALGRVHVLVNNAAIMPYGPVLEMDENGPGATRWPSTSTVRSSPARRSRGTWSSRAAASSSTSPLRTPSGSSRRPPTTTRRRPPS